MTFSFLWISSSDSGNCSSHLAALGEVVSLEDFKKTESLEMKEPDHFMKMSSEKFVDHLILGLFLFKINILFWASLKCSSLCCSQNVSWSYQPPLKIQWRLIFIFSSSFWCEETIICYFLINGIKMANIPTWLQITEPIFISEKW